MGNGANGFMGGEPLFSEEGASQEPPGRSRRRQEADTRGSVSSRRRLHSNEPPQPVSFSQSPSKMTHLSKRLLLIGVPLLLVGGVLAWMFLVGVDSSGKGQTLYTCGMHPQIVRKEPGNCPICGMKLTPIRRQPGGGGAEASNGPTAANPASGDVTIRIDPVTIQNMGIRTTTIESGPLKKVVRTIGTIGFDEGRLADVTTKFRGWVEKLHVDAVGQQVHSGDPLFEIYSPELYSAQVEYLLALDQAATAGDTSRSMVQTASTKLRFFDVSAAQIADLEKQHEARKTLRVGAPIDGFVIEKNVVEGMMFEAGTRLYRIADLSIVWVNAQVYEQDLSFMRLGQEATVSLSYLPDRKFRGRVTYIYPTLDEKTRTVRVRMEFHNPGYLLKPGMFASVEISADMGMTAVLVPDSAILRSGERNTTFVALEGGRFEPRTVVLGMRAEDDRYQVLSGLAAGERVVTSGQFMLDSESQLREAIQKMREPGATAPAGASASIAAGTNADAEATAASDRAASRSTVYICPMPEHVSIEYDEPGRCAICGMTLVPVSPELLARIQPGGKVVAYTCPMPEHSDVRLAHPGKCPRCGMTLIPVMASPPPPGREVPDPKP